PGVEPDRVLRWAERAFEANRVSWYAHVLGLALYRAGRDDEAIAFYEPWIDAFWQDIGYMENKAVLAMAHHRRGDAAKARDYLDQVDAWVRKAEADPELKKDRDQGVDWLPLQVLRLEAEALIRFDPAFPADPFAR